jgi:hypothetical protein
MFNGGIHENPAHPSLKGAFTPEAGEVAVDFHETVLEDILRVFRLSRVAKANGIHFRRILFVQLLLHSWVALQASLYYVGIR